MKFYTLVIFLFLYVGSFVYAQEDLPVSDIARETARIEAENLAIRAEIAELREVVRQAEAGKNKIETFSVSLDCSKYTGAARDMCQKALIEPNEHERSHYINSMCRNMPENKGKPCIHLGWVKDKSGKIVPLMTRVDEPAGTIPGLIASNCTPSFFRSCHRYSTYFLQPGTPLNNKWDNVSYLFDEWGAYNIGGRERLDKALKGDKADLMINIVEGPMDFVVIAASIAQYTKTTSQQNFQDPAFRAFMKAQLEVSMKIVRDVYAAQAKGVLFKGQTGGHTREIYEQFILSQQAQLLKQMYGETWFNDTFNIVF
ncbi:MAG: hypothetical protein EXS60_01900 [Candidatus Pacebacteria bacterium]|nr:hypothetical protein [Candidatus Paceibacterota bacterium]